jgi:hypothetical protein
MGTRRCLKRFALAASLAALTLTVIASPSGAAVTLGQIGAPPMGSGACGNGLDLIQPTVSSGNPYVVPNTGGVTSWTVTSWTTLGGGGPEQRAFKVFRKIAEPATYEVVAHDGPRALTPGGTAGNTFRTALPVRAGDVLGVHMTTIGQCSIDVTDSFLLATTDLGDGQSGSFGSVIGRLEVEAVVTPTSDFTQSGLQRNKKKGTATLTFNVPNPGELTASGNGVKASSAGRAVITKSVTAGPAQLLIKAQGKKKGKLNQTGKIKLNVAVSYTPTGGDPSTQSIKVKLKKKL